MAEITPAAQSGKRKKGNPRVDLTPMVDLGFLLVTFFVFTSTMSTSVAMKLILPKDDDAHLTPTPKSGAVTIIPNEKTIWYYEGSAPASKAGMHSFSYANTSLLRARLLQVRQMLVKQNGNDNKLMVMIKPATTSNLGAVVNVLDEMTICNIQRFAIVDIQPADQKLIAGR